MKTLHNRCAGLDVHKVEVVACLRLVRRRKVEREVRRFLTTTRGLLELAEWLRSMSGSARHHQVRNQDLHGLAVLV